MKISTHTKEILQQYKQDPEIEYQLICLIGEGTYGQVYKAINRISDQLVAIKILKINNFTDLEQHQIEVEALKEINKQKCNNIVKLYDTYVKLIDEGMAELWLILEYCQMGSALDAMQITKLNFSEQEISCIVYDILQALKFLHSNQRMHRDVKPGNILINEFGDSKLSDFGISSQKNLTKSMIGSPCYMSPEQVHQQAYTNTVDIWALGICVIELAETSLQYSHLQPVRAMQKIKQQPQVTFKEPNQFSSEINEFLSHCMQIDSEKRWTAEQLLKHPFIVNQIETAAVIKKNMYNLRKLRILNFKKSFIHSNYSSACQSKDYRYRSNSPQNQLLRMETQKEKKPNISDIIETQSLIQEERLNTVIEHKTDQSLINNSLSGEKISLPNTRKSKKKVLSDALEFFKYDYAYQNQNQGLNFNNSSSLNQSSSYQNSSKQGYINIQGMCNPYINGSNLNIQNNISVNINNSGEFQNSQLLNRPQQQQACIDQKVGNYCQIPIKEESIHSGGSKSSCNLTYKSEKSLEAKTQNIKVSEYQVKLSDEKQDLIKMNSKEYTEYSFNPINNQNVTQQSSEEQSYYSNQVQKQKFKSIFISPPSKKQDRYKREVRTSRGRKNSFEDFNNIENYRETQSLSLEQQTELLEQGLLDQIQVKQKANNQDSEEQNFFQPCYIENESVKQTDTVQYNKLSSFNNNYSNCSSKTSGITQDEYQYRLTQSQKKKNMNFIKQNLSSPMISYQKNQLELQQQQININNNNQFFDFNDCLCSCK